MDKKESFLEHDLNKNSEILEKDYALIHGDDLSGKTTLCKHLFLTLVNEDTTALFINLQEIESKKPTEKLLQEAYEKQYEGSYDLWKLQENKTIILDNLSNPGHSLEFVTFVSEHFKHVIVSTSSDQFRSYFMGDERLAQFVEIRICNLSHIKQEELIRKRLELTNANQNNIHEKIDLIENKVNSVIINNRLLPRYPFYILSILQTYEGFMPNDIEMTSHGHCYYVLILANLIKSGIQETDDQINTCFNFSERLAFEIYKCKSSKTNFCFDSFIKEYKKKYIIKDIILNRMQSDQYGILAKNGILKNGIFKHDYMYFFFLGKYFANNGAENKEIICKITEESHLRSNSLILLFIIYHTNDITIIDDILIHTMCSLGDLKVASLEYQETKDFGKLVAELPEKILSDQNVEIERKKVRSRRDMGEQIDSSDDDEDNQCLDSINSVYRILKNNEVLGRILRNKYGSLEREKLLEIIETISDSGLRLISVFLSQDSINGYATYLHEQDISFSLTEIKNAVQRMAFLWTMINIERIVSALNIIELRELVTSVAEKKATPAYDLIKYFSMLDSTDHFGEREKKYLKKLLKQHNNHFMKTVLSLRTQQYLNTHSIPAQMKQSICSLLRINYKASAVR